jgi:hypothetical protein
MRCDLTDLGEVAQGGRVQKELACLIWWEFTMVESENDFISRDEEIKFMDGFIHLLIG